MRRQPGVIASTLGLCGLVGLACGEPPDPPPAPDTATRRSLSTGDVVGFETEYGAHAWRGIPFAAPPTGPLRWRAPRPPEPWPGVREALAFGAPCMQFAGPMGGPDEAEEGKPYGSEDCLTLNVFAPRFPADRVPTGAARRPVMVWIHGGGNTIGSADVYESSKLAVSQDVVVVTVHYRLGAFGWFRHPALHDATDSADDRSGNYGTLDLVRALEWVRDNASAFGGDPGRVTVFGESAGGINVYTLLLSPRARGLFHGAIAQSGLLWTSSTSDGENRVDDPVPGHARSSGEVLLSRIEQRDGVDRAAAVATADAMSPAEIGALLRDTPPGEFLSLYEGSRLGGMYDAPTVFGDGHVLPEGEALDALARGDFNRVPVITGTNRDENKLFLLFASDDVTRLFGIPLWLSDERRYELFASYQSRMWKAGGVDEPAAAMARVVPGRVFAYRFDWDEEPTVLWADFSKMLGAAHALEIPFVLGHLDLGRANRFLFDEARLPAARKLSGAMMSYWGAFAHAGAPGRGRADGLPGWLPWDAAAADGPKYVVLDTDADGGIRMSSEPVSQRALIDAVATDERFDSARERCELYANFVQWRGRMTEAEYETALDGACREFPIESFGPS